MTNIISLEEISKEETIRRLEEELRQFRLEEQVEEVRGEIGHRMANMMKVYLTALAKETPEESLEGLTLFNKQLEVFGDTPD